MQEIRILTSLAQLIVAPEKFHGKRIRVIGYLHRKFEDHALYFSKDDADYTISSNGMWVSFAESPQLISRSEAHVSFKPEPIDYFDCKYVMLEGTFNMGSSCYRVGNFTIL